MLVLLFDCIDVTAFFQCTRANIRVHTPSKSRVCLRQARQREEQRRKSKDKRKERQRSSQRTSFFSRPCFEPSELSGSAYNPIAIRRTSAWREALDANANMVFRRGRLLVVVTHRSLALSSSSGPHELTVDHPTSSRPQRLSWRIKLRKHARALVND